MEVFLFSGYVRIRPVASGGEVEKVASAGILRHLIVKSEVALFSNCGRFRLAVCGGEV